MDDLSLFDQVFYENFDPLMPSTCSNQSKKVAIRTLKSHLTPQLGQETEDQCPVCVDGVVGRHFHYGGRACHSCRGFFRRSVQNGHYPLFQCSDQGNCVIKSKTRKSCKFCRFRRFIDRVFKRCCAVRSFFYFLLADVSTMPASR